MGWDVCVCVCAVNDLALLNYLTARGGVKDGWPMHD